MSLRERHLYKIMRVISIINQKGGVGKTTTAVNLSHALAMDNYKVLAIDMDPQSHLSMSLPKVNEDSAKLRGIDEVLLDGVDVSEVGYERNRNLNIIPAGEKLSNLEQIKEVGVSRALKLKNAFEKKTSEHDFILIDCPPSTGLLAMNALFAGEEVLVPVVGDYLSLCGVSQLMKTIKSYELMSNKSLPVWFVLTRFHTRGRLAREVMKKLLKTFPGRVLKTAIRETVAVSECAARQQSIFEYSPNSNGSEDYKLLAKDLVNGRVW